ADACRAQDPRFRRSPAPPSVHYYRPRDRSVDHVKSGVDPRDLFFFCDGSDEPEGRYPLPNEHSPPPPPRARRVARLHPSRQGEQPGHSCLFLAASCCFPENARSAAEDFQKSLPKSREYFLYPD